MQNQQTKFNQAFERLDVLVSPVKEVCTLLCTVQAVHWVDIIIELHKTLLILAETSMPT